MQRLCDKSGLKRRPLFNVLTSESAEKPLFETWIRRTSDVRIEDTIRVNEYAALLANLDLKHETLVKLPPDRRRALEATQRLLRGKLDRAAMLALIDNGLMKPFFNVTREDDRDGPVFSLEWMLKTPREDEEALELSIAKWQHDCVDNNFFLCLTSYRLWLNLYENSINPHVTLEMAPALAKVMIGYGMLSEAVKIIDRIVAYYELRMTKADSALLRLKRAHATILRAVAHGRLLDLAKAEALFFEASENVQMASWLFPDGSIKDAGAIDDARRLVLRERLRMYANVGIDDLGSVWSDLPHWMPVAIASWKGNATFVQGAIDEFRKMCDSGSPPLPIDWDTLARASLLFRSDRADGFLEGVRWSKRAYRAYRALGDDDPRRDIDFSVLTLNSLDTTRILLACARGRKREAARRYHVYDQRIPAQNRQITRRSWQGVSRILSGYRVNLSVGETKAP